MKNQTFELTKDIFTSFTLLNEEMINVRGGDGEGEPIVKPSIPPFLL
jgi:hypothetical protein